MYTILWALIAGSIAYLIVRISRINLQNPNGNFNDEIIIVSGIMIGAVIGFGIIVVKLLYSICGQII